MKVSSWFVSEVQEIKFIAWTRINILKHKTIIIIIPQDLSQGRTYSFLMILEFSIQVMIKETFPLKYVGLNWYIIYKTNKPNSPQKGGPMYKILKSVTLSDMVSNAWRINGMVEF